jgi:putative transposase
MSQQLNHYAHCVYRLDYHLVLVTKYRRKALNGSMIDRFRELARERCEAWRGGLMEMDGEADHVHLLVSLPPTAEPAKFVNNLKTTTSRLLRRDFAAELGKFYRKPVLWSASYFIVSCGGAPLETIKKYIQDQETPK